MRDAGRVPSMRPAACALALATVGLAAASGCVRRPVDNPNIIVFGVTSGPNNLDPRIGSDDTSEKVGQLIFSSLMTLDEHLRVVPLLAERLDHPTPTTYVVTLRRGVRFHDGHELTAADVVYTYRSLLAPGFVTPLKGAFRLLKAIDARDRYTVMFTLWSPLARFRSTSWCLPSCPTARDRGSAIGRSAPGRTGSCAMPSTIASS
jgi:ABC-type transport system substrate-binding protein